METVYGNDFADHFIQISELYKSAHGSLICGRTDTAVRKLTDIVRRLELMETAGSAQPALITDKTYESLCVINCVESVRMKANSLLISLDKEWDAEKLREINPEFAENYLKIQRLAETEKDVFMDYCRDTFAELAFKGE